MVCASIIPTLVPDRADLAAAENGHAATCDPHAPPSQAPIDAITVVPSGSAGLKQPRKTFNVGSQPARSDDVLVVQTDPNGARMQTDLVWLVTRPDIAGAERCRIVPVEGGWDLSGVVVAAYDGRAVDVRYALAVDEGWGTRSVAVTMDDLVHPVRLELSRSTMGRWTVDGRTAPELEGCVDVDLGISPLTNTLPIRRLGLDVGEEAEIEVAWVRFPEFRVDRGRQRYARLAADVWRYSSEGFTADLVVDEHGLVVRYGHDLWRRIALAT